MAENTFNITTSVQTAQQTAVRNIDQVLKVAQDVKTDANSMDIGAYAEALIGAGLLTVGVKKIHATRVGKYFFKINQCARMIDLMNELEKAGYDIKDLYSKKMGTTLDLQDLTNQIKQISAPGQKGVSKKIDDMYKQLNKFSEYLFDEKAVQNIIKSSDLATDLARLQNTGIAGWDGKIVKEKLDDLLREAEYLKPTHPFSPELKRYQTAQNALTTTIDDLNKKAIAACNTYESRVRQIWNKNIPEYYDKAIKNYFDDLRARGSCPQNMDELIQKLNDSSKKGLTPTQTTNLKAISVSSYVDDYMKAKDAFTNAEKAFQSVADDVASKLSERVAGAKMAALETNIKRTAEIVRDIGHGKNYTLAREIYGNNNHLRAVTEDPTQAVKKVESLITEQAEKTKWYKGGRATDFTKKLLNPSSSFRRLLSTGVLTVGGALLIWDSITNNYTPDDVEDVMKKLEAQLKQMPEQTSIRNYNNDERLKLLNYLIKHTPADRTEERKYLANIKNAGMHVPLPEDVLKRLEASNLPKEFIEQAREHLTTTTDNAFFDSVAKAYPDALIENVNTTDNTQNLNDTETEQGGVTDGSPTSVPEPDPTASPDPNKKPKPEPDPTASPDPKKEPEPDPTAKTDEDPDKQKGHSGKRDPNKTNSLDEIKNPQNMSKQDLQDYLERGKILAAKKQLGKLTPEEEQEFKALSSAFNGYNSLHGSKQTDTSGKGNGTQKAPGNPPITTPGNTPGNAPGTGKSPANDASGNSDSTKTLPPEALIQADQRGFWERNWDWIVAAVAAVAVAIGAVFLIRKQKKKTDKAKDEASTLQTQVTDLTNKVNELTEKKDGSTLANNSTQINTDTLDGNTGNGENTTIIVPSSKSMG